VDGRQRFSETGHFEQQLTLSAKFAQGFVSVASPGVLLDHTFFEPLRVMNKWYVASFSAN
jgi:hypothetical protein